ncbi:MAG: LysE family transporter [Caldilineaceae bacterium]|nr:LysE family transporter [Caldilineaceae bacterium]
MTALLAGLTLGLSAGISPGPLMTLVMSTTLARGLRAGLQVAAAPLVSDAPVILLTLLVFTALPPWAEAVLTGVGGLFVLFLGAETLREARHATLAVAPPPGRRTQDLWRGALVNLLSPHPWLFWLSVGAPLFVSAWRVSPANGAAFLLGFYLLLIGSKVTVALAVAGGRRYLTDVWYRRLLTASGLLLGVLGLLLIVQAGRMIL